MAYCVAMDGAGESVAEVGFAVADGAGLEVEVDGDEVAGKEAGEVEQERGFACAAGAVEDEGGPIAVQNQSVETIGEGTASLKDIVAVKAEGIAELEGVEEFALGEFLLFLEFELDEALPVEDYGGPAFDGGGFESDGGEVGLEVLQVLDNAIESAFSKGDRAGV